jgi:hypothetical protein
MVYPKGDDAMNYFISYCVEFTGGWTVKTKGEMTGENLKKFAELIAKNLGVPSSSVAITGFYKLAGNDTTGFPELPADETPATS